MKRIYFAIVMLFSFVLVSAQESRPFKGKIVNDEYQVWIEMDFYESTVVVP